MARDALGQKQRDGMDASDAVAEVVNTICFVEIDGLTSNGKPLTADDVRADLGEPAMEPLALLILKAVERVDQTREAKAKALAKN
jgi:hypothetical protein